MADKKNWLQLLAYVTGSINQELLLRTSTWRPRITSSNLRSRDDCGCLMARGRPWPGLPNVWDGKPYRKSPASPNRIRSWPGIVVAQKFDGSKKRGLAARPQVDAAIEELVVKLAGENSGWGYDRIVGAVVNLGH